MNIMKRGGPTRPGVISSMRKPAGLHSRLTPVRLDSTNYTTQRSSADDSCLMDLRRSRGYPNRAVNCTGIISTALAAVLVPALVLFGSPLQGLAAEDNSNTTPAPHSDSSAKQPKPDDKPAVLKCPRCGSTDIYVNRCSRCGFKLKTRRARTNTPALRSGADSKLRSPNSGGQGFQRSMRSLDDSVRRMNTDINRTRTIYRQLR